MLKLLTLVLLVTGLLVIVPVAFSSHEVCPPGSTEVTTESGTNCIPISETSDIGPLPQELKFELADYRETIELTIDRENFGTTTTVLLTSKNHQDFLVDPRVLTKLFKTEDVINLKLTTAYNCDIPEMVIDPDLACVKMDIRRDKLGNTLDEIKKNSRAISDSILNVGNNPDHAAILYFLGIGLDFHSILLGTKVGTSIDQEKQTVTYSDEDIVTVNYVFKRYPAEQLFDLLLDFVVNDNISKRGGFIDTAKELLQKTTYSTLDFTLIRTGPAEILREINISFGKNVDKETIEGSINPMDLMQVNEINRSDYFSDGFYPLNSIIRVQIIGDENLQIKKINTNMKHQLESTDDLTNPGWFFISKSGSNIDARYLFGQESSVSKEDLTLSIGSYSETDEIIVGEIGGGGCLIATAAFGSEMAPQVQFLREIRDNTVLQTESGASFMAGFNQFYYSFSPAIADYERENPVFKETVKLTLTPLLTSLTLLQYVDIDSESEMLGYGIGIILLNVGMYFVAPVIIMIEIRKRI